MGSTLTVKLEDVLNVEGLAKAPTLKSISSRCMGHIWVDLSLLFVFFPIYYVWCYVNVEIMLGLASFHFARLTAYNANFS